MSGHVYGEGYGPPPGRRSLRSPEVALGLAVAAILAGAAFDLFGPDYRTARITTSQLWIYGLILPWVLCVVFGALAVRARARMGQVAAGGVGGLVAIVLAVQIAAMIADLDRSGFVGGERLAFRVGRLSPFQLHVSSFFSGSDLLPFALGLAIVGAVFGAALVLAITGFDRSTAPAAGAAVAGAAIMGIQPIFGDLRDNPSYMNLTGLIGVIVVLVIIGVAAALDAQVPARSALSSPAGSAGPPPPVPGAAPSGGLAPTNAFAVVSLVLGLLGGNLLAVIFGHVARGQIRQTGERGDGLALAGLILGYAGLVLGVIAVMALMSAS